MTAYILLTSEDPLSKMVATVMATIIIFGVVGIYRWIKSQRKTFEGADFCQVCKSEPCKCTNPNQSTTK